jgi:hypothetical protein
LRQPPPARAAHPPIARRVIIEDVNWNDSSPRFNSRRQSRMIGQTQIAPEPKKGNRIQVWHMFLSSLQAAVAQAYR